MSSLGCSSRQSTEFDTNVERTRDTVSGTVFSPGPVGPAFSVAYHVPEPLCRWEVFRRRLTLQLERRALNLFNKSYPLRAEESIHGKGTLKGYISTLV